MKNKKSIYVLLPLAVLIWGGVVYQFFSFSSKEVLDVPAEMPLNRPLKIAARDTASLKADYRDPFLGKAYSGDKKPSARRVAKKLRKPSQPVTWPKVAYKGIVSDQKGKRPIFMLEINNKMFLLKRGEIQDGILLEKGDRNNVELIYEKQRQTFPIK